MSEEIEDVLATIRQRLDEIAEGPRFTPGFIKGDEQAARYCGMKRRAFWAWVRAERVPYKEINGHRYYKLTILERRMTPVEARGEEGI